MSQHVHDFIQIHKHFSFTAVFGIAHADLVECDPIADVRGHGLRLDGAVKGVDGASGGLVGVLLEVKLVFGP